MSTDSPAPIKLLIWDLDDTFWEGTLSEGPIRWLDEHLAIVQEAARRGIPSAICSRNDHDAARRALEAHDAWSWFVFPHIAWTPKGQAIAQQIERMQLRPPNVLFLDDNPMNLQEAAHYAPGLQVATPDALADLLARPTMAGKPDPTLDRLEQYRLLERKDADRAGASLSNDDFLRQSGITVHVDRDVVPHRERIAELLARTNQLNFTKVRLDDDALDRLLADPTIDAGVVHVRDRYGDYGLCGFFAVRGDALEHFLFSCRAMSMGVEQWVYAQLGRPEITVCGEVSASLDEPAEVDWIAEAAAAPTAAKTAPGRGAIFFKGGCDLEQVLGFVGAARTTREINTVLPNGHAQHAEHTALLRQAGRLDADTRATVERLPFLTEEAFATRMFEAGYDVVVYSVLMDYTQGLYRHREQPLLVPFGDFEIDITRPEGAAHAAGSRPYPPDFFAWFSRSFAFEGALTPAQLAANVRWLRARLRPETHLVLLNGAEVAVPEARFPRRHEHHAAMNAALDAAVAELPSTTVCDVRRHARDRGDVTDNLRHYERRVYHAIAHDLRAVVAAAGHDLGGRAAHEIALEGGLRGVRRLASSVKRRLRALQR